MEKMFQLIAFVLVLVSIISVLPFPFTDAVAETDSNLETYIVHVRKSEGMLIEDLDSWYESFLPVATTSSLTPHNRLVHSYRNVVTGFAAKLRKDEAELMQKKEEVLSVMPQRVLKLHTTHSPSFLGLRQNLGFWKKSNYGKGIIVGVLDTGITPGHPSFNDEGMPSPPTKWKGKCELKGKCNKKLIGVRDCTKSSAVDEDGHGTHTSSTAAGNFVKGANLASEAFGTATGMAPLAHLAMYKVCSNDTCDMTAILKGMDLAIDDGVDVMSLSLGSGSVPFYADLMAIASFRAMQRGIFVSSSAGNEGPGNSTISNEAPWMLTVGASTTDRSIRATVQLGDKTKSHFDGESLYQPKDFTKSLPLVYAGANGNVTSGFCAPGSLKHSDVKGKIVLCERGGTIPRLDKGKTVKDAGGAAMILMNDQPDGYDVVADFHLLPASHVSYAAGLKIKSYINSTKSPQATILFKGTITGLKDAPAVASFSSRGPNLASPGILKPDIMGPGVSILAAWPVSVDNQKNTKATFNMASGTSMSCPHLSGVAALLKSAHPKWSPAAIKSAIMTTGNLLNGKKKPIIDEQLVEADWFAIGSGNVNPTKANNPGLIYDIQPDEYIPYLCGLDYTDLQVGLIVGHNVKCSKIKRVPESQLNYPSFSVKLKSVPRTFTRTVTNVGPSKSSYTVKIVAPHGVEVTVKPDKMHFSTVNQKASYRLTFGRKGNATAAKAYAQGYLMWSSSKHTVRSPIVATFG